MTNKEILKKAIKKAIKNNWKVGDFEFATQLALDDYSFDQRSQYFIIFSHKFAKAFWGERSTFILQLNNDYNKDDERRLISVGKFWERHLQQMVKEKEPLLYLKRFL